MPVERTTPGRRAYIDWARGLAVLLMIEAHTLDAWTRPVAKHSRAFGKALILGGFAAPLFLWLAGLATALSAVRLAQRLGSRPQALEAVCRRGLEIFLLAFLFRLQAFVVSPGSYLVTLFRVDILNIMGPAIVAAGLVWAVSTRPTALAVGYASLATVVALATPIVRTAPFVDGLPLWLQWYVRPFGDFSTFTAFPWTGFVFAGAASGALLSAVTDRRAERRLHVALAATGLALVWLGFYTSARPSIYHPQQSSFWSSSPTWFAIRAGVILVGISGIYGIERLAARLGWTCGPLERLGRHSLFVYWIHIELVYGYVSWGWRARLPFWGALVGFALFSALMYGAVLLKGELEKRWRFRDSRGPASSRVPPVDGAMVA